MNLQDPLHLANISASYSLLFLLILSLSVLALSAYVKIATVLGIVRVGLGFGSIPSVFVTGALALALSYAVMHPVLFQANNRISAHLSAAPALTDAVRIEALEQGMVPWRSFLRAQTHEDELQRFSEFAVQNQKRYGAATLSDASTAKDALQVLAPAFIVSQLKDAFQLGLRVFLPFLAIDLLVGLLVSAVALDRHVSLSISLAAKLLVFVLCDGWTLLAGSLLTSYAA